MAQNSAHVTQTLQPKPSIFELAAADSLQSAFHPALKRIANFLANLNPEKFGWMTQYYDELYLLINAAIQQHYIPFYGGSLAEVFYSITRSRINSNKFTKRDRFVSFICIVLLPYIHTKIEHLIQKWTDQCENESMNIELLKRKRLAINIYKGFKTTHDCAQIVYCIAYLADLSKSHSVLNKLIGIQLNYLPTDTSTDWTWSDLFLGRFKNSAIFTSVIFRMLELSAFFLQFIQWWQNETNNGSLTDLPTPDAPVTYAHRNAYKNLCPICLQQWRIPTVNRISGYVFCYKCIVKHLDTKSCCPVTNYASSIDDLIRIYDNDI